ncbi:MAG TPA: PQQ-dependent dehydrogenase, methanol/ethanol family [Candidatus Acidoferrales bacterium]|jgi:quinohemoprotein ethanol dehydrogenase|nr:PQQ-dependent dehydrogenase, methanol/ethanol family [Candidatus Acidoferrales bacterium]
MKLRFLRTACAYLLAAAAFWMVVRVEKTQAQAGHAPASYGQIDTARLLAANQHPGQWLTTGRDFGKGHFSPLTQINKQTVSRLGFAWSYDTHTIRGLEATPIVVDGVMYAPGPTGIAFALDAKTGKEIWTFDPHNNLVVNRESCCDEVNRGVAVWRGKVYVASFDGRLFALDAKTGAVVWHADTIVDHKRGYTSTGAPQVAGTVVVIGNAGGEFDARGYVSAYDLDSGKLAWRFFTVPPAPGKPLENPELKIAQKTWDPKSDWAMGGGGTVWGGMAYDPDLNLLYFGTGNGTFFDQSKRSPSGGDNLYISSILAIHANTGRLAWYYQEVPGDQWDYDVVQDLILTDLTIDGKPRKVLMQASKDGFFYIIDRATGKVLSANKFVPVTWADHVDLKTGRPAIEADARDFRNSSNGKGQFIQPSPMGGHNWNPMSYDPDTGLVYIPTIENGQESQFSGKTYLRAWDPIRGKAVWNVGPADWWDHAGVLSTAGGLVFQGTGSGHFRAYDANTGELLKDIDVGTTIVAAPMSYEIDGVRYIAVMAAWGGGGWSFAHPEAASYQRGNEGRVLAFKLDGGATPIPPLVPKPGPIPQPPPLKASAETVKHGGQLFSAHCTMCHINQPGGLAPDLRRMSPETHDAFNQIVLGGILKNAGMPPWNGVLSQADADAIHAYLISISWDAYKAQQAGQTK